jgi:hypothetical protein
MAPQAPNNSPADRVVSLAYRKDGLTVEPPTVKVKKNGSLTFRLDDGPPNGSVRITFQDPTFFSAAAWNTGDPPVVVVRTIPNRTMYECDLVVGGQVQPRLDGQPGGGVEEDRPL